MESVRAAEGDGPIGRLYEVYGEHIHHRKELVSAAVALAEAGLAPEHAAAFDDPRWDPTIKAAMDEALGLTGNDVGTPILAFETSSGERVGYFGPVISRRLPLEHGLRLWDGLVLMISTPGLWELKRTRTEAPDFTTVADS